VVVGSTYVVEVGGHVVVIICVSCLSIACGTVICVSYEAACSFKFTFVSMTTSVMR